MVSAGKGGDYNGFGKGRGGDCRRGSHGHNGYHSGHRETQEEKWIPIINLGHLVKKDKKDLEQIYLHSLSNILH